MNKNVFITLSVATALSVPYKTAAESGRKPNVLVIMADQWRSGAIGCLGKEPVMTPNIDRMAAEGVICLNATSPHPVSSPARASFMTGQYPLHHGVLGNCNTNSEPYGVELKEGAVCWSDILKENGYSLGYIGKWHLDSPRRPYIECSNNSPQMAWNEWCSPDRRHGFDYWLAYGTYDNHMRPMYWDTGAARNGFKYIDQWGPEYEANKAIEFIENKNNERDGSAPFALVVSMNPPHTVYSQVPDKYKDMYKDLDMESVAARFPNCPPESDKMGAHFRKNISNYYACITGVDEQIGRVINHIDSKGLGDNTIIVFVSDHGDCIGLNGYLTKNNIYDASFTIPFIVRYKGQLAPAENTAPIDLADFYPTLFGLMGRTEWISEDADGEDLSGCLKGIREYVPSARPYLNYTYNHPIESGNGVRGIRTREYTYAIEIEDGEIISGYYLDNIKDPYQLYNGYGDMTEDMRSEMNDELKKVLKKTGDPFAEKL